MRIHPLRTYSRLRYAPFLCQVVVTRRCNLSCAYCSEYDKTSEPVPLDTLLERVDKVTELGSFGIEFTGGEPLLHPDLSAVISHAAQKKQFKMVGMITNAYLLTEKTVEQFNEAGLTDMQVSIDAVVPREDTVKALKPVRSRLKMIARKAKFKVTLSGVVGTAAPYEEVEEVILFAKEHGFRPRILLVHGDDGQLQPPPEQLRDYRKAQKLIGKHWKDFIDYREKLISKGKAPFRCRAGSRYLYIDEFGTVRWCAHTAETFGKQLMAYDGVDLKREFYRTKDCNAHCTLGCARSSSMVDGLFPQDDRLT
jgi:MoaA/NifB/PqqE/SkfB family radical SAM enzyme